MANYCTKQMVVDMAHDPAVTLGYVQDAWLDWVDALIEQYTGQGYKGLTRIIDRIGDGTSIIRLPSKAASITSIYENGSTTPMETTAYRLSGSRLVERLNIGISFSYFYSYSRTYPWLDGYLYEITYVEPTVVPKEYEIAATECAKDIALWTLKNKEFGLALTASDAGSAGKVSTATSTSFPANMLEEIHRTIQRSIRKPGI